MEIMRSCFPVWEKAKLKADTIYLFSIQRFDEKLSLEAKMKKNLKLISLEDM